MTNVRVMNDASLEPWIGNIIDLTLSDGTHRVGLLQKVDDQWAQLNAGRGNPIPQIAATDLSNGLKERCDGC